MKKIEALLVGVPYWEDIRQIGFGIHQIDADPAVGSPLGPGQAAGGSSASLLRLDSGKLDEANVDTGQVYGSVGTESYSGSRVADSGVVWS